jgi:serine protease Do
MKQIIVASVASAVLTAGFILAGQALNKPKAPPPAPQPLTIQQIAAIAHNATVSINVDDGRGRIGEDYDIAGSGFFISPNGNILTANHVANDQDMQIQVVLADGTARNATILYQDKTPGEDFTVLHVDGVKNHPFLTFGDSAKLVLGDPLVIAGNPLGVGPWEMFGRVSAQLTTTAVPGIAFVGTDATIDDGNSGGPALNALGQLIGMVDEAVVTVPGRFGGDTVSIGAGIGLLVPSNVIARNLPEPQKTPAL